MKVPVAECQIYKVPDDSFNDRHGRQQMTVSFSIVGPNDLLCEFADRLLAGELELKDGMTAVKKKKKKKKGKK